MTTNEQGNELCVWDLLVDTGELVRGLGHLASPELVAKARDLVSALQELIARTENASGDSADCDPEADELEPEALNNGDVEETIEDDLASREEIAAHVEHAQDRATLYFVAEYEGGLRNFALVARVGGELLLYQNSSTTTVTRATIGDLVGNVVWSSLTDYKLGHGWRMDDVLAVLSGA